MRAKWRERMAAACLLATMSLGSTSIPGVAAAQMAHGAGEDARSTAEPGIDVPFGHAWLGAPDADVTLVVFTDYACPACRVAQPVIDRLLARDGRLKVVYRLLDNDQGGRTAALTSLAVARISPRWGDFHRALDAAAEVDDAALAHAVAASGTAASVVQGLGDGDPDTADLTDELSRNDAVLERRGGTAIPSWVIGDGSVQRGFDLPRLQAAIATARAETAH